MLFPASSFVTFSFFLLTQLSLNCFYSTLAEIDIREQLFVSHFYLTFSVTLQHVRVLTCVFP